MLCHGYEAIHTLDGDESAQEGENGIRPDQLSIGDKKKILPILP